MGSDNNGSSQKKRGGFAPWMIVLGVLVIVVIAIAGTTFYSVDETEQAVITRFGKYYEATGPGLHFKMPFGIDKSYIVPVKVVQTQQFGFSTTNNGSVTQRRSGSNSTLTMLTGDLNIVDVEWIIQYRIVDPAAWLFSVNEREQTIRDISQSVVNTLVGDRAILDVMSSERASIEKAALEMMNDKFKEFNLGINVSTVKLQNIVPPAGVQDAFEDVNKATQDMNRFINEGREAYNAEIPRAQGERDQEILIAKGYAAERVNRAKGDVARFNSVYEEYRKSPAITRQRLYLEAMEEIFKAKENSTLIDRKLDGVLPIKNLSQGGSR